MTGSFSSDNNAPAAKKQRSNNVSPTSFVTWNCNSLPARGRENNKDLRNMHRLVTATNEPDIIMIQETMCLAASPSQQGELCEQDSTKMEPLFIQDGPFHHHYEPIWSLPADKRHHGTLTLVHKRLIGGEMDDSMTAFTTNSAIDLLLKKYTLTRDDVGISTTEKHDSTQQQHHEHGRFQFVSFPDMDVMNTYVPNNGNEGKPETYQRRQEWDDETCLFLKCRIAILEKTNLSSTRQLVWAGDLNVAKDYKDGSHWTTSDGTIEEWWTNEHKSLYRPAASGRDASNIGHSCFTPAERTRFETMLTKGHLTDVWRQLHPNGTTTSSISRWEHPDYTWRGSMGKHNKRAKYEGRAMRIDYFLTSNIPMDQVAECEILGYGTKREGLFCGSDHCAVKLVLHK